jgi:SAM-dependent methyltransferase
MSSSRSSISISVRRHFVDGFFDAHSQEFKGMRVADIGGKKKSKRGFFDIESHAESVRYINIDASTEPDILCDAAAIPVPDGSFDVALMGEVLEHVADPLAAITEACRILKPGGRMYATVPFLYPVHADPFDFGRYTDYYWKEASSKSGFRSVAIERQGAIFSVMALAIQHIFRAKGRSWRPIQSLMVSFLMKLDGRVRSPLLLAWTTGYGIVFTK